MNQPVDIAGNGRQTEIDCEEVVEIPKTIDRNNRNRVNQSEKNGSNNDHNENVMDYINRFSHPFEGTVA